MSDTPIYDALEEEYRKRAYLDAMTDVMQEYIDSIDVRSFELMNEDLKEVPAILSSAAIAVGNLLIPSLIDRQSEAETNRELACYVSGILDALDALRTLRPPEEV